MLAKGWNCPPYPPYPPGRASRPDGISPRAVRVFSGQTNEWKRMLLTASGPIYVALQRRRGCQCAAECQHHPNRSAPHCNYRQLGRSSRCRGLPSAQVVDAPFRHRKNAVLVSVRLQKRLQLHAPMRRVIERLSLVNGLEGAAGAIATVFQFVYASDWKIVPTHWID